jgi:hypothetical protein
MYGVYEEINIVIFRTTWKMIDLVGSVSNLRLFIFLEIFSLIKLWLYYENEGYITEIRSLHLKAVASLYTSK